MNILGTGLSGLVGSRITELLNDHSFENISTSTGVDITDLEQVKNAFKKSSAEIVLHLAAKADVDGCEKDKKWDTQILGYEDLAKREMEWREKKTAWAVNVMGTKNIVKACEEYGKKLIYISTDFVFSGDDQPENGYSEKDLPNPVNWYGETKHEGEKVIQESAISSVIARIAYPYRAVFHKKDFVRAVLGKLQGGASLSMVTDHLMAPTFIDDIAMSIDLLLKNNVSGIYHVVGSTEISPFDAATMIANKFQISDPVIEKTTRAEFFKDRAPRPFQLYLRNDRIVQLGVKMRGLDEGLEEIKTQSSQSS